MTEEDASRDTLEELATAIMVFSKEYCEERKINNVDIILSAFGVAITCLIDGTFDPEQRAFHARRIAGLIVRCIEGEAEVTH